VDGDVIAVGRLVTVELDEKFADLGVVIDSLREFSKPLFVGVRGALAKGMWMFDVRCCGGKGPVLVIGEH